MEYPDIDELIENTRSFPNLGLASAYVNKHLKDGQFTVQAEQQVYEHSWTDEETGFRLCDWESIEPVYEFNNDTCSFVC